MWLYAVSLECATVISLDSFLAPCFPPYIFLSWELFKTAGQIFPQALPDRYFSSLSWCEKQKTLSWDQCITKSGLCGSVCHFTKLINQRKWHLTCCDTDWEYLSWWAKPSKKSQDVWLNQYVSGALHSFCVLNRTSVGCFWLVCMFYICTLCLVLYYVFCNRLVLWGHNHYFVPNALWHTM